MVGCVKYGLDCWMMDVEGKCSADAVARGLPACTRQEGKGIVRAKKAVARDTEAEEPCWSEPFASRERGRNRAGAGVGRVRRRLLV